MSGAAPRGIDPAPIDPATIALGTPALDELRLREFARLDHEGHRYFDYTGAGLHAKTQVRRHAEMLLDHTLGNPHSYNPTSTPATEAVEATRRRVLRHFGGTDDHVVVFTANATAALKLVGESFDFTRHPRLLLTADNHNSVNGIREYARRVGARLGTAPIDPVTLRVDPAVTRGLLETDSRSPGLFAFPAQSNYSGVQHPLELVKAARDQGWRVLLDAAAFAPTNRLDLSSVPADFVAVSFYKMFGHPTGVGALLARRDALAELRRPWFAGGTIAMASVAADAHRLTPGAAGFEDGTPNFLSIPAVSFGLDLLEEVGIHTVHERVGAATSALLGGFAALRHGNGAPVVRVLGPTDTRARGGTVAFNVFDPDGQMVHDQRVQELATARGISLRSGCFCNPGCGEAARGLGRAEMARFFAHETIPDYCDLDDAMWTSRGSGASALRASVGWVTNAEDVAALLGFLAGFADRRESDLGPAAEATRLRGPDSP